MKPKILLLSNTMLFHYSFCSLYKNQFDVHPLLLRYLNRNLKYQSDHFFIQIQEQKRKKLYSSGSLTDPNRLILTSKSIQKILDVCKVNDFDRIVLEINNGSKEEVILLKELSKTNVPIIVFVTSVNNTFIESIENLKIVSINQFTDIFNLKKQFISS